MPVADSTSFALDRALDAAGAASFVLDVADRSLAWSEGAAALFAQLDGGDRPARGGTPPRHYGAWLARLGPEARRRLRDGLRHAVRTETVLDLSIDLDQADPAAPGLRIRAAIEPEFDGRIMGLVHVTRGEHFTLDHRRPPAGATDQAPRGPCLNPEAFDPVELIADAGRHAWLHAQARRLELIVDVPGEIPRLALGEPARLQATLSALLDDAVQHCDAGFVELRARHDAVTERLELSVEDTGAPGLASGELLGHRVAVTLPCPPVEVSADHPANDPGYAVDGHGHHALLVCEKRRTAAVLAARLREVGLHTTALSDTVAATRTFAAVERLDLVVIEPEIEGVATAELIACWRAARPEVPVILARQSDHAPAEVPTLDFPWTAESVARSLAPWLGRATSTDPSQPWALPA